MQPHVHHLNQLEASQLELYIHTNVSAYDKPAAFHYKQQSTC